MKKEFNITGICHPDYHYMVDTSAKVKDVMEMVEKGKYFTINRPRQYGKTTTLGKIQETLEKHPSYIPIKMNFQGVDGKWHKSDEAFAQMFFNQLKKVLRFTHPDVQPFLKKTAPTIQDMGTLSEAITDLTHQLKGKITLLIDEVDASSNFEPFLNFLGMLRTKYLDRFNPQNFTFHSIILAGVHDIKTLKFKMRGKEAEYNSPWNIAADFKVEMSFNPEEIATMLRDYREAEAVEMDIPTIAERLYYHTAGYPFLVSKLCKTIAEDILPQEANKNWTVEFVETAVQLLLKENNTNFDSLIKNLENNQALYNLVYRVIIEGEKILFNPDEPVINLGKIYGVFKDNGRLKVHNRIYEQRIYNYMTAKTAVNSLRGYNFGEHFLLDDNALDMKAVLLKFQQFMKEQHSRKNKLFLEEESRIIFLAFFAPILNGQGHSFKEVQTSLEKRLDVVVTYFQHRYIIELKRWYGPKAHEKGLDQLADYLDIHGVNEGYLLIFDYRADKSWEQAAISHKGKDIFAVWV